MVNRLADARFDGKQVHLEIALYHYGNDALDARKGFISLVHPMSTDLDGLSQQLFSLRTNGGSEYCGMVIQTSLDSIQWSTDPEDLRFIIIAGNEPFGQGPVNYLTACKNAAEQQIIVNTIHCGDYEEGKRTHWYDCAALAKGRYLVINTDEQVVHIPTPYDTTILRLNMELNKTYIGYGSSGMAMKSRQMKEDKNAESLGAANAVQRTAAKTKASYSNASWDLVDAYAADSTMVERVSSSDLPDSLQILPRPQLAKAIEKLKAERLAIRKNIAGFETQMQAYIAEERKKIGATKTLDQVMIETIVEQAVAHGFQFGEK